MDVLLVWTHAPLVQLFVPVLLYKGASLLCRVLMMRRVRWKLIDPLLCEDAPARGLLTQRPLKVLQLTQEVEVWGNGGSGLFHKPYE